MKTLVFEKLDKLLFQYQNLKIENKSLKNELEKVQNLRSVSPVNTLKKVKKTKKAPSSPSLFE